MTDTNLTRLLDERLARLAPVEVPGPLPTPCLVATRNLRSSGYARCHVGRRSWQAHRLAWTLANGEIPAGAMVLHHCDRPACIAIDHLHLGDAALNAIERIRRGRARVHAYVNVGSRNGMSKLSERKVRWIRRCTDCSTQDLARRYRVSPETVRSARRRVSWRHVR